MAKRTPEQNRAIYERRVAKAKAQGFSGYGQQRRAGGKSVEEYRAAAAQRIEQAKAGRRQVHELPDQTVVTTTSRLKGGKVIEGRLAAHGTRPVTMKVVMADGTVRTAWAHGYSADRARRRMFHRGGNLAELAAAELNLVASYGSAEVDAGDIASVQFTLTDGGV